MNSAKKSNVPLGGENGIVDIYAQKVVEEALCGNPYAVSHAMHAINKITKEGRPLPPAYQYFLTEGIRRIVEDRVDPSTVFRLHTSPHGVELEYRNFCLACEVEKELQRAGAGKRGAVGRARAEVAKSFFTSEGTIKKAHLKHRDKAAAAVADGSYETMKSMGPVLG